VCEANASSDGGVDSVANLPKGQGKERVGEEVEVAEAQPKVVELQWGEAEAQSKQMGQKRGAKTPH
jgi:hypothetical protein